MAKKVTGSVKLQIAAGKATPAPPVGPALGQAQINIMEFCKQFNARTNAKELEGLIIPVVDGLQRPLVHLHHQDAAGFDSAEAGGRHRQRIGRAQQGQSGQGHGQAGRGHRQAEDAGPECSFDRGCREKRPGNGAVDGNRCSWIIVEGHGCSKPLRRP